MSSAFYPLGMKSYNNYTPQGGYKTWKGANEFQNPIAITSSNQRPQTNKDYRNIAVYKQGLPRPMKHYRKGTSIPISQDAIQEYYSNRQVASSTLNASIGQLIDRPGTVSTKPTLASSSSSGECNTCLGQSTVSSWAPIQNLTEKPQPNTENATLCCNAQKKARKRVLPASTILKKNYYTTHSQYLHNRCQTFEQRAFNFYSGPQAPLTNAPLTKPGAPESSLYEYVANCSPNVIIHDAVIISVINRVAFVLKEENIITQEEYDAFVAAQIVTIEAFITFLTNDVANSSEALALLYKVLNNNNMLSSNSTNGCKKVIYKPNNYQYAQQGAVTNSARMLRLNVNAIDKYISNIKVPTNTMIYKNKVEKCNPAYYRKNGDRIQCQKA